MKAPVRVLCLITIVALTVFIGCGKKSTSPEETRAMAESLQFETATLVNNLEYLMDGGLYYLNYGAGIYAKPADTSYFVYDDMTSWWTYHFEMSSTDPWLWQINELDSIRFSVGDVHQMEPDTLTDGLEFRVIGYEYMQIHPDTTLGVDYDFDCEFSNADADTVDIDGNFMMAVDMTMSAFNFAYSYNCQYNNIRYVNDIYSYDNHPFTGTIGLSVAVHSTGDRAQGVPAGDYNATMTLTFNTTGFHGEMTLEGDHFSWDANWDDISQTPIYGGRQ